MRGTYVDHYQLFGNAEVMSAKLMWEFASYWAIAALPFMKEKLQDLDFGKETMPQVRRIIGPGGGLEQMFRDWHGLGQLEWRDAFISHRSCPAFWQFHLDLHEPFDDEALKERFAHNAEVLRAFAVVLFHKAVERLPDQSIDPDQKINPDAISLQPDRWEKDRLFSEDGLSLNEARAAVPGIENMLLSEVAQPA